MTFKPLCFYNTTIMNQFGVCPKGEFAMKAAVQERAKEPIAIKEVPDPMPEEGEVLIKVCAAGVCHTDLHIADGDLAGFGYNPYPLIMGHEIAGVVEQVGSRVQGIQPGDRVGVQFLLPCGHCPYCRMGEEESCLEYLSTFAGVGWTINGGYAEYVRVPASRVIPLPPQIDFVDAASLFCAGLTAYAGFKNAALKPGQRVAVLGIGGVGHLAIQIARAMGAEVIAITSTEEKIGLAKQLGAHAVINGADTSSGKRLMEIGGANVILSTTVAGEDIASTMAGLLPQGTLVLTGATMDVLPIIPMMLMIPQQRVIGSLVGSCQEQRELLQLAVEHDIRPMTETFSLEEVNLAHEKLRSNQVRFRAILTPG
jgi:alcohol dehydrogenase, propanol-preferring